MPQFESSAEKASKGTIHRQKYDNNMQWQGTTRTIIGAYMLLTILERTRSHACAFADVKAGNNRHMPDARGRAQIMDHHGMAPQDYAHPW